MKFLHFEALDDFLQIARRLEEICQKHKQKPKIFQYNSIDVEGIELL